MKSGNEFVTPKEAPSTRVRDDETLGEALTRRGLTRESNIGFLGHLVREGQIGLISSNGKARFALEGRHMLGLGRAWKGLHSVTDRIIQCNDIQIVTVDEGTMGLMKSKGKYILLEPGQHILKLPQQFVEAKRMDAPYVKLGTHHWVTVPLGSIAVAYDDGRKIIITPQHLDVDPAHQNCIRMTDGGRYQIESPTFIFNDEDGIKSVQMEDIELSPLVVNTQEMVGLRIIASLRYQIIDPVKAFLLTEDVVGDLRKQAHATLTSVFSQLSVNELGASLASAGTSELRVKGKGEQEADGEPSDLYHHATALFMREFNTIAERWGVKTQLININSMTLEDRAFLEVMKAKTQQSVEASTCLAVVDARNKTRLAEAEQAKAEAILAAEAEAAATKLKADARAYAATQDAKAAHTLAAEPLAVELALTRAQGDVAAQLAGKGTTVIVGDSRRLPLFFGSSGSRDQGASSPQSQVTGLPRLMSGSGS